VRAAHVNPGDGIRKIGHVAQVSVGGSPQGEGATRGLYVWGFWVTRGTQREGGGVTWRREGKVDRWGMSCGFD
jgi:hypothetical protein